MNQVPDKQLITYSIGHGNRRIEAFINLLKLNQIDILIDVRSLPYSRFSPQFRQANLKASLNDVEITYLWLGNELGGRPKDQSLYCNGQVSYEAIKQTDLFKSGIQQILSFSKSGIKVTLMCSEGDQNNCHRKHLISDELLKIGFDVIHINKQGHLEKHIIETKLNLFS
ncbi:DUF488 domain-containing protein [Mucilaginibacter panaciglaebae]|uniref:DUF488 domain-containing protein n=1 Tax=Mucilaginibacter panaciglaebae TaxID=502331 RepID=A0ABP7WZD2_9SPHI